VEQEIEEILEMQSREEKMLVEKSRLLQPTNRLARLSG